MTKERSGMTFLWTSFNRRWGNYEAASTLRYFISLPFHIAISPSTTKTCHDTWLSQRDVSDKKIKRALFPLCPVEEASGKSFHIHWSFDNNSLHVFLFFNAVYLYKTKDCLPLVPIHWTRCQLLLMSQYWPSLIRNSAFRFFHPVVLQQLSPASQIR